MPMRASLSRRITLRLGLAFAIALLALAGLWLAIGRQAIRTEQEAASLRIARLFEGSLRQAMLSRDLDGLAVMIERLGQLPGMQGAHLLEPGGRVRFASDPGRIGEDASAMLAGWCLRADCRPVAAASAHAGHATSVPSPRLDWRSQADGDALRVAWPVANAVECAQCHGSTAARPVNGVLVLDFAPPSAEREVRERFAGWFLPAALLTLLGLGAAVAWVLQHEVLQPLAELSRRIGRVGAGAPAMSQPVSAPPAPSTAPHGRVEAAAPPPALGHGELAELGQHFDHMAARIDAQVRQLDGQQAFLRTLLNAAPDPMLLIGADHRIQVANEAYARLVDRPLSQIVGQPCHRISRGLAEPCAGTLVDCPLQRCVAGGPAIRTTMSFVRGDGRSEQVEIHAAALRTADGGDAVVEVVRSLDEQVRFSQEQRLAAVGLLANGVAHEIHNPLASIRLALQSSLRSLREAEIDRRELSDYLRLVDHQIDRCVHITQRLLRLSQPSVEAAQPVRVSAAVDDVRALMGEEARQAGVTFDVTPEPSLRVLGDEGELRQILLNLVQNALHAMPGGGRLSISAQRQRGGDGRAMVRLSVADTGTGIEPERQALIFQPFYSQRADGRRGTGMGLAICKSLVDQRQGRIELWSAPGQGSRFDVWLPDADAAGDVVGLSEPG